MIQTPTGGHYSLLRVLLGVTLGGLFLAVMLEPSEGSAPTAALAAGGLGASLLLIAGIQDRLMAVILLPIFWHLHAPTTAEIPNGTGVLAALLLLHILQPASPYGSWSARGRTDPRGDWAMDRLVLLGLWALLGAAYGWQAIAHWSDEAWRHGTALQDQVAGTAGKALTGTFLLAETLFLPLCLWSRSRAWIWSLLLARQVCAVFLGPSAVPGLGMVLLHLWTFSPAWVPATGGAAPLRLFYDGTCGLCHRTVRFLLAEDRTGRALHFAPLHGPTFLVEVPEESRRNLPDSFVARTKDGAQATRSDAVLWALQHLGGVWRVLAVLLRVFPRPLRDLVYDGVARIRHRLFKRPQTTCPILPEDLRGRFAP